jgi:hypothetical protein
MVAASSVDDAHQRLAGLQRAQHLLAQRLFLDAGDEVAHHGQGHVGFQQGHAHFAQHVLHVGFGDAGLAAHLLDEAREFVGECGGHSCLFRGRVGRAAKAGWVPAQQGRGNIGCRRSNQWQRTWTRAPRA